MKQGNPVKRRRGHTHCMPASPFSVTKAEKTYAAKAAIYINKRVKDGDLLQRRAESKEWGVGSFISERRKSVKKFVQYKDMKKMYGGMSKGTKISNKFLHCFGRKNAV